MTKSEKEDYIMMCLSKSMKPHGVTNNLGRNFLLGQLIGEQMDCSEFSPSMGSPKNSLSCMEISE